MTRVEIHLDGQKRLLDTTRELDREVVKQIRMAVQASARDLRTKARSFAPKRSGNLRRAIKFRSWTRFLSATVFVDAKTAPYRHLVLPFMRMAFDTMRLAIIFRIRQAFERAFQRGGA